MTFESNTLAFCKGSVARGRPIATAKYFGEGQIKYLGGKIVPLPRCSRGKIFLGGTNESAWRHCLPVPLATILAGVLVENITFEIYCTRNLLVLNQTLYLCL